MASPLLAQAAAQVLPEAKTTPSLHQLVEVLPGSMMSTSSATYGMP